MLGVARLLRKKGARGASGRKSAVNPRSNGDMQSKPEGNPEDVEIERLLRMAAYYQRLGCINVAMSLRALADAKKARRAGEVGNRQAG